MFFLEQEKEPLNFLEKFLSFFLGRKGRGYGSLLFGGVLLLIFFSLPSFPFRLSVLTMSGVSFLSGILFLFLEERILQKKTHAERAFFRFLLKYIPDHVYFKDRKGRFVWASESLARHFGLERVEDCLGKTDFDFFSLPHAQEAFSDEERIIATGEPVVGKVEKETWPDGRTNWVHTTKIPLCNERGEIMGIVGISRDVTDLREKEDALERERAFLQDVFESVQDGISVLDRNLNVLTVNSFMEKMYADSSPLVGRKCYEVYHGRTSPCSSCPSVLAMEQGKKVTQTVPYVWRGEPKGWLEVTAYPFRDREGRILGVIECLKDVTERIEMEEALRESEEKFRTLTELSPTGIVIYQDHRYVYCNPMAAVITGYTQEEILSMPVLAFIHPEDRERVRRNVEARQRGERAEDEYEIRIVRKDGTVRWLLLRGSTVRFGGRFAGLVATLDITEWKAMTERILRLNRVLKGIRNVNQLITREKDRKKLIEGVCRELVEGCGYTRSLIILYSGEEGEDVTAHSGFEGRSFPFHELCRAYSVNLHPGKVWKIAEKEERCYPLSPLLLPGEGFFVVPLEREGKSLGILLASLPLSSMGDEEEEALFLELAQDLAFALHSIELEREKERMHKALVESEAQYADLFYHMVEGLALHEMIFDEKGHPVDYRFLKVNSAFERLTGLKAEEIVSKRAKEVLPDLEPFLIETYGQVVQRGESVTFEHYSGSLKRYYQVTAYSHRPGQFATIFEDITTRKLNEERIQYLTFHDILTGAYNRTFLEREVERLDIPENLPLSVIMGDLNGLKLVNDTFGHAMGDELLRRAAKVLMEVCGDRGIVARLGGDEFVVLLPHTRSAEVHALGENIQEAFRSISIESIPLSISLGYGTKTKPEESLADILRIAENWMYQRKLTENMSFHNRVLQAFRTSLRAVTQETEEHSQRIRDLALHLGRALGLSQRELDELSLLAEFHDIGKISIPQAILEKPGPLDEEEWSLVKKHPEIGFRIAQSITELSSIANYVLFHHERFDGRGYPRGLKGKNIPLLARVIAICDAYDVMVTGRPYRQARTKREALEELKRCAETQFDPRIVEVFVTILEDVRFSPS